MAPYNGTVAVVHSSEVQPEAERIAPAMCDLLASCRTAAERIGARAPIRIDRREDAGGIWRIFDVKLGPTMTGPGRPGREDQLSLSGMAAAAAGMRYGDLPRP